MTVSQDLRQAALRHLWMQAGGWIDMAEGGEPIIVSEARGLTDNRYGWPKLAGR